MATAAIARNQKYKEVRGLTRGQVFYLVLVQASRLHLADLVANGDLIRKNKNV